MHLLDVRPKFHAFLFNFFLNYKTLRFCHSPLNKYSNTNVILLWVSNVVRVYAFFNIPLGKKFMNLLKMRIEPKNPLKNCIVLGICSHIYSIFSIQLKNSYQVEKFSLEIHLIIKFDQKKKKKLWKYIVQCYFMT